MKYTEVTSDWKTDNNLKNIENGKIFKILRAFSPTKKTLSKLLLFLLVVSSLQFISNKEIEVQANPGGISSNLDFWLNAESGLDLDGTDINGWTDQSPNSILAFPDLTPGYLDPQYQTNSSNFNPTVGYLADDEALLFDDEELPMGNSARTIFIVANPEDTEYNDTGVFSRENLFLYGNEDFGGTPGEFFATSMKSDGFRIDWGSHKVQSSLTSPDTSIATVSFEAGANTDEANFWLNGEPNVLETVEGASVPINTTISNLGVVGDNAGGSDSYIGDIAEVIIYDTELSDTERSQVESYLSLKYGITKSGSNEMLISNPDESSSYSRSVTLGQSFTATSDSMLTDVQIGVSTNLNSNTATQVDLYICEGSVYCTAGNSINTTTGLPVSPGTPMLPLGTPLEMVKGNQYTYAINPNSAIRLTRGVDSYSGGTAFNDSGVPWAVDYTFFIHGYSIVGDYLTSNGTDTIWDNARASAGYHNDVVGIGRDISSTLDQRISKSISNDAVLTITTDDDTADYTSANGGTRTQLNDLEFVSLTNNDGAITSAPVNIAGYSHQIGRQWHAQVANYTGSVNAKFDIATLSGNGWEIVQSDTDDFASGSANLTKIADIGASGEVTDVTFVDGKYYGLLQRVNRELVYSLSDPYDASKFVYAGDGELFDISDYHTNVTGVDFSTDGTKMFTVGYLEEEVNEFILSAPFDISTAVFSHTVDVGTQENRIQNLEFNNDGTKMFIIGNDDVIYEYTLSEGFALSTASYAGNSETLDIGAQDGSSTGIGFSADGMKLFSTGLQYDLIHEYDLSAPFDVSTGVYTGAGETLDPDVDGAGIPGDVLFNEDGSTLYVHSSRTLYEYTLGTPYDISTATFEGIAMDKGALTGTFGVAWSPVFNDNGTKLIFADGSNSTVSEFVLGPVQGFTEVVEDNGSLVGQIGARLVEDTFADIDNNGELTACGGSFACVGGEQLQLGNIPAEFTPTVALYDGDGSTSNTNNTATVMIVILVGNAANHENIDDISDITFVFADNAFNSNDAGAIDRSGDASPFSTNFGIDYISIPGVDVDNESGISITEDLNNGSFGVALESAPTSDVVIDISSADTGAATVSPSQLTFTSSNWSTSQSVTITPVSDNDVVDEVVSITFAVNDANSSDEYDSLDNVTRSVTVTDDDSAGFSVIPLITGGAITEGSTSSNEFSVVLDHQPQSEVIINISSANSALNVDTGSLTFTTANWSTQQPVSLTASEDDNVVSEQNIEVTISVNDGTSDNDFDGLTDSIEVDVIDNDTATITVSPSGITVAENAGSDTFTVVLGAQPTSDVVIDLTSVESEEATVSPAQLTFTSLSWNTPQIVTVTGVADTFVSNDSTDIMVSVNDATSDDSFDGLGDTVEVTLVDDEVDSDNDKVSDDQEAIDNTDPSNALDYKDSDGDGVPDVVEESEGSDPNEETSFQDSDNGGAPDYVETILLPNSGLTGTDPSYDSDDEDSDGDGTSNSQELNSPNNGDGNGDGIPDYLQPNVANILNPDDQSYVTLVVAVTCDSTNTPEFRTEQFYGDDPDFSYPYGLLKFEIGCANSLVEAYWHGADIAAEYEIRKYGNLTPGDDSTGGWYDLESVVDIVEVGGESIVKISYNLTDGQLGDDTGVDGVIIDPVGLALLESEEDGVTSPETLIRTGGVVSNPYSLVVLMAGVVALSGVVVDKFKQRV